jgi:hypothetical protein
MSNLIFSIAARFNFNVFASGYRHEMSGIAAGFVAATVMKFFASRHFAYVGFVKDNVRHP